MLRIQAGRRLVWTDSIGRVVAIVVARGLHPMALGCRCGCGFVVHLLWAFVFLSSHLDYILRLRPVVAETRLQFTDSAYKHSLHRVGTSGCGQGNIRRK